MGGSAFPTSRTSPGSWTGSASVQVGLLEEFVAVGGADRDLARRRVADDLERHDGTGRAERPDAAEKIGEARGLRSGDLGDEVAHPEARLLGRAARRKAGDD